MRRAARAADASVKRADVALPARVLHLDRGPHAEPCGIERRRFTKDRAVSRMAGATRRRMRAAVLTGPGRVRVEEVELPEPGPGQVRVRLEGCGVCASNLTPWAGPEWMRFPTEPGALGHEGWGVVDAVGDGVEGVSVGDRGAAISYHGYAECDLG